MAEIHLRKQQKADLAEVISQRGLDVADFSMKRLEDEAHTGGAYAVTHNELEDTFIITKGADSKGSEYYRSDSYPGEVNTHDLYRHESWSSLRSTFGNWVKAVQAELSAVDPWEEGEKKMEDDESLFTLEELPKIDRAVDASLEELKSLALNNGKKISEIEKSINEASDTLKGLARKVNKSEWLGIFKSVGVGLLAEWGINTELFRGVLQVLVTSATDVVQIAEHASKYL